MQIEHRRGATAPQYSVAWWDARDIPEPDWLMGSCLSTTNRWLIVAPTGLGKTNFVLALGMRIAEGDDFLHWKGQRKARVLYVDGEMSNRLLRQRLSSEVSRLGYMPGTFSAVCVADLDNFRPLNTEEGRRLFCNLIEEIGGVDLVIFDSVMCLLAGNMVDEAAWAQVMPLVHDLTKKGIGQIWVHHTGHDGGKSYGTKTREWQMDAVIMFESLKRADTDVSFTLEFAKGRERTPANSADFQIVKVALVNDEWTHELTEGPSAPKAPSPLAMRCLEALRCLIAQSPVTVLESGRQAASAADWRAKCVADEIIVANGPKSAASSFNKYRDQLTKAGMVDRSGELYWLT
ncbi:hypothetical protein ACVMAJ_006916 [Bradyrhizobium sp. USDA 4448]